MPNQKKQKPAKARPNTFVFFLILLSLIIGLFWVIQAWSNPLESDEVDYYKIGKNLCQLHKFDSAYDGIQTPTMSRPPVYPFLISVFYCLNGRNPNFVRAFQILLFIGIIVLVYLIAKLIFNEKTARISSTLTALYPAIGILTGFLLTEILFVFLSLLGTFFLTLFFKTQKGNYAFWSGIFFGLATLTRSVFLLFPIFLIFFLLFYQRFKITNLLKKSFLLFFAFILVISPWLIRNYVVFREFNISDVGSAMFYNRAYRIHYYSPQETRHFVLLSLFGSYLSKRIDPSYEYNFSKFEPHVYRRDNSSPLKSFQEPDLVKNSTQGKKILFKEAKAIILQHPIKYMAYSFLELFRIHTPLLTEFSITDLFTGTHPEISDFWKTFIIIFIRIAYLIFFISVIYGIVISCKKIPLTLPTLIIILYTILLLCSMETIPRYSIPLYPFYFIFFSFVLINFLKNFFQDVYQK